MEAGTSQGTEVTASASIIPGSGRIDTSSTLKKVCIKYLSMHNYKQKDISTCCDNNMDPCRHTLKHVV